MPCITSSPVEFSPHCRVCDSFRCQQPAFPSMHRDVCAGMFTLIYFLPISVMTCQLAQVREQNPKLAKQSRVMKVSMDNVYDFAVTPEVDKKTEGVSFRFMPDMKQVQKALEVRQQII